MFLILSFSTPKERVDIFVGIIILYILLSACILLIFKIFAWIKKLLLKKKIFNKPIKMENGIVQIELIEDNLKICPVCKKHNSIKGSLNKTFFGIFNQEVYKCSKCLSSFIKDSGSFKLENNLIDSTYSIWNDYKGKTLTTAEWVNIANGGMSDEKQEQVDMNKFMTTLEEGNGPQMGSNLNSNILLKSGEKIFATVVASLNEPRSIRTGGNQGVSFRVMKGVYYRVGAFKSESHEEIRLIDVGNLTITNKRLIFAGKNRNVEIALKNITNIGPYNDAIVIGKSTSQRKVYFMGLDHNKITFSVDKRSYQKKLNGVIVMTLIQGLVAKT